MAKELVSDELCWLSKYRRLTIRYERRDDIHEAFLHLGWLFANLPQLPNVIGFERLTKMVAFLELKAGLVSPALKEGGDLTGCIQN
jgi:hypothetical protein